MINATPLPFNLPAVCSKKLTVDFDGGNQSSDAGLLLLRAAERKIGIVARMAAVLPDRRDPTRVRHTLTEVIGARACHLSFLFMKQVMKQAFPCLPRSDDRRP